MNSSHNRKLIINDDIGSIINKAIHRGLGEQSGFPAATVTQPSSNLTITALKTNEDELKQLDHLAALFPELCKQNDISLLASKTDYVTIRKPAAKENMPMVVKYDFNVSLEDLDRLLLKTCEEYASYRNFYASGGSLFYFSLNENDKRLAKDNVVCLFPVFEISDNCFMIRNTGCNLSEVMMTQLSFLTTKYFAAELKDKKIDGMFGHYFWEAVQHTINVTDNDVIRAVSKYLLDVKQGFFLQALEGVFTVQLSKTQCQFVVDMNNEASNIYRSLGTTSSEELANLKSMEVPVITFLQALIQSLKESIKPEKAKQIEFPSCAHIYQENIDKCKQSIKMVNELIKRVAQEQADKLAKPSSFVGGVFNQANNRSDWIEEKKTPALEPGKR